MKNESNDRILRGLMYWKEREKSLIESIDPHIKKARHFQKEKLQYYISLRNQNKKSELTKEERSNRKIVKGEIRDMEKALYPNRVERILRRAIRQVNKIIDKYRMEDKVVNLLNKIPILNKKQDNNAQNYRENQAPAQSQAPIETESQTKNQNVKLDAKSVQTQKNEHQVPGDWVPLRNVIIDTPVRVEHGNEKKLKNDSLKQNLPKLRHKHRF
jgi:hypothetical protein